MDDRFSEPVDWKATVAAPVIWAAHFTVLWGASSVFPGTSAARWIALGATLLALATLVWLWTSVAGHVTRKIPRASVGLSAAAILFGAMPAVVG
jgi:hypothetical protein